MCPQSKHLNSNIGIGVLLPFDNQNNIRAASREVKPLVPQAPEGFWVFAPVFFYLDDEVQINLNTE